METTPQEARFIGSLNITTDDIRHQIRLQHLENHQFVSIGIPIIIARIDRSMLFYIHIAS